MIIRNTFLSILCDYCSRNSYPIYISLIICWILSIGIAYATKVCVLMCVLTCLHVQALISNSIYHTTTTITKPLLQNFGFGCMNLSLSLSMCVCVCVCARARACACACVCVCSRTSKNPSRFSVLYNIHNNKPFSPKTLVWLQESVCEDPPPTHQKKKKKKKKTQMHTDTKIQKLWVLYETWIFFLHLCPCSTLAGTYLSISTHILTTKPLFQDFVVGLLNSVSPFSLVKDHVVC